MKKQIKEFLKESNAFGEWGQIYGIEVKSSIGKQSDSQKEWQRNFEANGGIYILAKDLSDVEKYL